MKGLKDLGAVLLCFIGLNSAGQCPTIVPVGHDSCRIGTGTVMLRSSGSTGLYSWYDASTAGTFLGNNDTLITPSISSTTNYFVAARNLNTALAFDGAGPNDYVAIDNYFYNSTGNTEVTVEAWVRTTDNGNQIIASYDRNEYWRLELNGFAGPGEVAWYVRTNAGQLQLAGNTAVNDGNWHHVAGVYDNGTATIYVDGVLDATTTQGTTFGLGNTRYGFIGTGSEATFFNGGKGPGNPMTGDVDEVRIWSVARTQAQLQAAMDICLAGTETGLEVYYVMEDGTGSSTLTDIANSNDGTLFNMNVTTDWITYDRTYSCESCESARTTVTANVVAGSPVNLGPDQFLSCAGSVTLDAGAGYTNYLWSTAETTQMITVSSAGEYSVVADNGAGCSSSDTINILGASGGSQNSLDFDGGNDYIAIDNFFYNSTGIPEVTVEAWIKTTDGGNQIIASYDRSEYWRLGINGNGAGTGEVCWNIRTNSGIFDFGSNTRVDDGLWHHVAGVYDNGTVSIYIDGELDAQTTNGTTFGTGVTRYGFISSGSEATGFNGGRTPANEVDGELDDVRIWSVARTQAQIRTDMCKSSVTDNTGLEMYFDLNEGTGTAVTDKENSRPGTLFNMAPASDWLTSGAPLGDNSVFLYPVSWAGQTLSISSCSGDDIEISNVSGSPSGIHLFLVEGDPNSTTGITNMTAGNHYYGVFQTDDGTESYDLTYTYTGHPLLPAASENSAVVLDRLDNSVTSWSDNGSTVNAALDELYANFTGRQELILDYNEYVWTGTAGTNWATAGSWNPTTVPPAGANIRIPDVTNQPILDMSRQVGAVDLETGATVDLNGFTLSLLRDLNHEGTLSTSGGGITLNGTSGDQRLLLTTDLTADNITTTNSGQVSIELGSVDLLGSLDVNGGTFETNDSLTVVSNAFGTARIGEITGTGITGEIVMERYIDAGSTFWRYFSSAVVGATFEDYDDDFVTSGFPGSWYPSFPFVSIYTYDETLGPTLGYLPATSAAQVIGVGQGIQVYCGDTITGTLPFVVDLRGDVNQGNIAMPVSFTNTATPTEDGYCLVGNPYPSTIDWDAAGWTKTNMDNATYIQNPDDETYATYIGGASTNGGTRFIASQQSFWVKANAAGPVLTITESCKAANDVGFFRESEIYDPGCNIAIDGLSLRDECVIRNTEGTLTTFEGQYDANKLWGGWGVNPQISLLTPAGVDMTVHTFDFGYEEWALPLRTIVFTSGNYTIDFTNISELDVPCLVLEDTYDGTMYPIEEGIGHTFYISDTTYAPRFILHVGKNYPSTVTQNNCHGNSNGQIELDLDQGMTTFEVSSSLGTTTHLQPADPLVLSDLTSGIYTITIEDLSNLCGTESFSFVIADPSPIAALETITQDAGEGGSIEVEMFGGVAPYLYSWSNGGTTTSITELDPDIYTLEVIDFNGCMFTDNYEIKSVVGIEDPVLSEFEAYYDGMNNQIVFTNWPEESAIFLLTDANGKTIQKYKNQKNGSFILSVPLELSAGLYLLVSTKSDFQLKLVKQ